MVADKMSFNERNRIICKVSDIYMETVNMMDVKSELLSSKEYVELLQKICSELEFRLQLLKKEGKE